MEAFVSVFRKFGTASNYVSSVKLACLQLRLDTSWFDDAILQMLRGGRKRELRVIGGTIKIQRPFKTKLVTQLVALADRSGQFGFATVLYSSWEILARVSSEAVPAERGDAREAMVLPAGRHSAVYIDCHGALCVRWSRRKHRPRGSFLRRPSRCAQVGPQFCAAHRLGTWLEQFQVGQTLWSFSTSSALGVLRRLLCLFGVHDAKLYTWKCVQGGRAADMSARGCTLGSILSAGEWRSVAVLRYISEQKVGVAEALRQAVDASDTETES
ncbi:unnamed protein product [Prorocentrum cordatum]|uniref:Uncharacterized protein n=1 Tax=Prorocentrum cordatum TaxID=2364126 RepID=A0ABN9XG55_9DINO|nr:unnamed protein product [Polarella glacialis]